EDISMQIFKRSEYYKNFINIKNITEIIKNLTKEIYPPIDEFFSSSYSNDDYFCKLYELLYNFNKLKTELEFFKLNIKKNRFTILLIDEDQIYENYSSSILINGQIIYSNKSESDLIKFNYIKND